MASKIIYIDPGHGGSDSGASYKGRKEADDVLRLSLLIKEALAGQDVEVALSRDGNSKVPALNDRIKQANTLGAAYYLSVHRNSSSTAATGNEAWVIDTATANTQAKAKKILDTVCAVDGQKNRGVKFGAPGYKNFAVNRDTKMPSALLELGFINNAKDNLLFDAHIEDYAAAIAKALCEAVGVEYKEPILKGDVDGDEKVTIRDARKALRGAVGIEELSDTEKAAADVDGDGNVKISDAREILRKATGIE